MPVHVGRQSRFRKALTGMDSARGPGGQAMRVPGGLEGQAALPPEVVQRLREADDEQLLDLLRREDISLDRNRGLRRLVVALLRERGLRERVEAERLDRDTSRSGKEEEFFVGWEALGGEIRFVDRSFDPGNPAHIDAETLRRYRQKDGCGGLLGRRDDPSARSRAEALRQAAATWRTRNLLSVVTMEAKAVLQAVKPAVCARTARFLRESPGQVMVGLWGRSVILVNAHGNIHVLEKLEAWHLAQVGLFHRFMFRPVHWWLQQRKPDEEKKEAPTRRERQRIFQGRYDEGEVDEEDEEEKDGYGGD